MRGGGKIANPQKENGFTAIANEIIEALIATDLSGQELRISLLIIRKTYGFKKLDDSVSLSQMMAATGMGKIRCSQVVNCLQLMKILTVTENINGIGKKYRFNKDFDQWDTVNKKCNRYGKTKQTVKVLRNRPLRKTVTTKETITKETIQKKDILFPEWLPLEIFLEYQASRNKKLKPASFDKFFKKLKRLSELSRVLPEQILNQSIENGWEGIFELKKRGNNTGGVPHPPKNMLRTSDVPDTDTEAAQILARGEIA